MNIGQMSIQRERQRQISVEGFSIEHDDKHDDLSLYLAANCYYFAGELGRRILSNEVPVDVIPVPDRWPWEHVFWKPGTTSRRNYEKAGALYMAEVERLDRLSKANADRVAPSLRDHAMECSHMVSVCEDKINQGLPDFVRSFNWQQCVAHRNSVVKGFHDNDDGSIKEDGLRLMLITSELGEALEGLRHGNPPDDHIPEFSSLEAELADVVIRCMDMAETKQLRLAEAIMAKMDYNASRPHRHGNKLV